MTALSIAPIVAVIGDASPFVPFLKICFQGSPYISTVAQLGRFSDALGASKTAFLSRFQRAKVPSPKRYLDEARLVRTRAMLDIPSCAIADAADLMQYSSASAFHRKVRDLRDRNGSQFRHSTTTQDEMRWFIDTLIRPYAPTLRTFDPYAASGWARTATYARRAAGVIA